jgi:hypothetical protein
MDIETTVVDAATENLTEESASTAKVAVVAVVATIATIAASRWAVKRHLKKATEPAPDVHLITDCPETAPETVNA